MIRFHLTALTLKTFSCCEPARSLYRGLGNWMGGKQRRDGPMPAFYFDRAQRNVAYCQRHRPIQPGDKVVELGTGWVHWEALTLRLFFDFEAVLYDVWDNRQLSALKSWVRQLEGKFGEKGFLEGCDFDRARAIIKTIQAVNSFDELYDLLGFRYIPKRLGIYHRLKASALYSIYWSVADPSLVEHAKKELAFYQQLLGAFSPGI